ncbi:unnamed protein product [Camellia sinensis]
MSLAGNRELTGKLPSFINGTLRHLWLLDLSETGFTGELPNSIGQLEYLELLSLVDCNFFGTIPTSLANLTRLISLDLSYNNFEGPIPQLFSNFSQLQAIYFSNNQLTATFGLSLTTTNSTPSSFRNITTLRLVTISVGPSLKLLNMQACCKNLTLATMDCTGCFQDHWQGVLPRSLANCTKLEILNLGHNFIEDAFPFWLENLPQLKVIVLRDNKFHGPIEQPRKRLAFTNLHIIDMSHNEFTGTLPSKFFESMPSMMMDDEDKSSLNYMQNDCGYYSLLISYTTKFDGNIPISIGRLRALVVLNFSGNGFIGSIPLSLVNLTELESLDLSQNKLFGKIPQQLTSLTFLEVFDVSQNKLIGKIPQGQQFETFSNTSYEGNIGLCGLPLSKKCGSPEVAESPSLSSSSSHDFKYKLDGFEWEAVLMGYGCGVVIGLVIGSCIIRRKEKLLVRILVKMCHQKNRSNEVRYQHGTRRHV